MDGFAAIVLICLKSVSIEACDENTAVDVRSIHVENELRCAFGWQEIIARTDLGAEIGTTSYLKTLCRRSGPERKGRG